MIYNFKIKLFNSSPLPIKNFILPSNNLNSLFKMSLHNYSLKKYYSTKQNNNYYYPPTSPNDLLNQLTYNLNTLKFQKIQTDFSIRRASVAAILRVVPRNVNQVNGNFFEKKTINMELTEIIILNVKYCVTKQNGI